MSRRAKELFALVFLAAIDGLAAYPSRAAPIIWVGANGTWIDNAGTSDWVPPDEPDSDDEARFLVGNSVDLGSNNLVDALSLAGSIDLATNGRDLTVNSVVRLSDAGTNLIIEDVPSTVTAGAVEINSGAQVRLMGGTLNVLGPPGDGLLDINAAGGVYGVGTVLVNNSLLTPTTLIVNDGSISASSTSLFIFGPPDPGTLVINAFDPVDARIDLDGATDNGVVNVFRNQTLDVNIALTDAFSGNMFLYHNARLDVAGAWTLDAGTIDVNCGFIPAAPPFLEATPADVSYISGGALTQTGGTITVDDGDGVLQFNAPFTQTGGAVINNGLIVFNANATIGPGAHLEMTTISSSITVAAGVTVNVHQPDFVVDGFGLHSNRLIVHSGGVLDLDMDLPDDVLSGTVQLNGGTYRSTHATNFAGRLTVGEGESTVAVTAAAFTFDSASETALHGDLRLENSVTIVEVGAGFTGSGALFNASGHRLDLLDGVAGADLAVLVQNEGTLQLGALGAAGQVEGASFIQQSLGAMTEDIGGTDANDFDHLSLTGSATLAGQLDLQLVNGFVPTSGQEFEILTAAGGVNGTFDIVNQPPQMPEGLFFDVIYTPTSVQLQATSVSFHSADFDLDGDVDGADLAQWQGDFAANGLSDADNDGDSDGADFLAWQQQLGSDVSLANPAVATLTEAASLPIAAAGLLLAVARLR